jgi:hypothetical protein
MQILTRLEHRRYPDPDPPIVSRESRESLGEGPRFKDLKDMKYSGKDQYFEERIWKNACSIAEDNQTSDLGPLEIFERGVEMVMLAAGLLRGDFERVQTFAFTHFARGTRDPSSLLHWLCIRIYTLTKPNSLVLAILCCFLPFPLTALKLSSRDHILQASEAGLR